MSDNAIQAKAFQLPEPLEDEVLRTDKTPQGTYVDPLGIDDFFDNLTEECGFRLKQAYDVVSRGVEIALDYTGRKLKVWKEEGTHLGIEVKKEKLDKYHPKLREALAYVGIKAKEQ